MQVRGRPQHQVEIESIVDLGGGFLDGALKTHLHENENDGKTHSHHADQRADFIV